MCDPCMCARLHPSQASGALEATPLSGKPALSAPARDWWITLEANEDDVVGYVDRLPESEFLGTMRRLPTTHLAAAVDGDDPPVLLDVREPGETSAGVIENAVTIPLGQLEQRVNELDPVARTVVYCASGIRSAVATSLLAAAGFDDVADLRGGFTAWQQLHASTRP